MSAHCLEQLSAVAAAELSRMKAAFHLQVQTHRAVRMLSPSSPSTHCSRIQIVPAFFWASFLGDDQVINLKNIFYPVFAFMDGNTNGHLVSISADIMI